MGGVSLAGEVVEDELGPGAFVDPALVPGCQRLISALNNSETPRMKDCPEHGLKQSDRSAPTLGPAGGGACA